MNNFLFMKIILIQDTIKRKLIQISNINSRDKGILVQIIIILIVLWILMNMEKIYNMKIIEKSRLIIIISNKSIKPLKFPNRTLSKRKIINRKFKFKLNNNKPSLN